MANREKKGASWGTRCILCALVFVFAFTSLAAAEDFMSYTSKDIDRLTAAAEGGDSSAWVGLGYIYYFGDYELERDLVKAREYFDKAADAGNTEVLPVLAKMYENGTGGSRDLKRAYDLYKKAADAGDAASAEKISEKQFDSFHWRDTSVALTGRYGVRQDLGGWYGTPFFLDRPVVDCSRITMEFCMKEYTGYPFGRYALRARDLYGRWHYVDRFKVEKDLDTGKTVTYTFELPEPISFTALAVVNGEDGMQFELSHEDVYYVDQACLAEYSDSISVPSFTPAEHQYAETSAYFSAQAYVNPFG